ncbi:activating signal cointegrator 1 complex subunit 2 homolog [Eupeodes corollae]|uniref:activating signal cointegrator 1 complex subunit 2 homolog n=1 Tax=Eupeodes corollae TaxID=290404 RepID=UPI002491143F|nr:activating signal cointegrator 1 complex subunit 2 homolog [Eupeodes corollae]
MFSKLAFVALISVVVAAPQQHHTAGQFPAGVDPSKCPNFPICDNAALHGQQPSSAPSWNQQQPSQSQWNQPQQHQQQQQQQWNPQPEPQWNQPKSQQWNQPQPQQWNQPQPQQWNQQPQQQPQQSWNSAPYQAPSNHLQNGQDSSENDINGPGGDKYPAGVNPKSCPNYPYCDVPYDSPAAAAPAPQGNQGYNDRQSQYPAGVSPHSCPNFPYCS